MVITPAIAKPTKNDLTKTAQWFCTNDKECIDIVSLELDSMYQQGLNEKDQATVGTLINRKARTLNNYCTHAPDKKVCEAFKSQLMLKYMSGLLER